MDVLHISFPKAPVVSPFYETLFLEGIQPKIYFSNYPSGISVIAAVE